MATGSLTETGQQDWLAAPLIANQAYEFTVTGLNDHTNVFIGTSAAVDQRAFATETSPIPSGTARP